MVPEGRAVIMVHPRLRHSRDTRRGNARPRYDIGIGGRRLAGLVDEYGILRGDLLVQSVWLDLNDAFWETAGSIPQANTTAAAEPRTISLFDCNLVSRGSISVCFLLGLGSAISLR